MMGKTGKIKAGALVLIVAFITFISGMVSARPAQHTDWLGLLTFGREIRRGDPGIVLQETLFETVYARDILIGLREDGCLVWKWAEQDSISSE